MNLAAWIATAAIALALGIPSLTCLWLACDAKTSNARAAYAVISLAWFMLWVTIMLHIYTFN